MEESKRPEYGGISGALVTAIVLLLVWQGGLRGPDRWLYDWGVRGAKSAVSTEVVLVEIDQRSLDEQGPWPWPRARYAELLDLLESAEPSVIGLAFDLTRAETHPARAVVSELRKELSEGPLAHSLGEIDALDQRLNEIASRRAASVEGPIQSVGVEPVRNALAEGLQALKSRLRRADAALDGDRRLIDSLRDGPAVILPFAFAETGATEDGVAPRPELAAFVQRSLLRAVGAPYRPLSGKRLRLPIPSIGAVGSGLGYLRAEADSDGIVRSVPLLVQHQARLLPSMALALVAAHRGMALDKLRFDSASLRIGEWRRAVSPDLRMRIAFYPAGSLRPFSAADILAERVEIGSLRNKIVLIGPTAASAVQRLTNPRGESISTLELLAHSVSNLLQDQGYVSPVWADWVRWGVLALAGLFVILLLPRFGARAALLLSLVLAGGLLAAEYGLLLGAGLCLPLSQAAVLLLSALVALLMMRGLTPRHARAVESTGSAAKTRTVPLAPSPTRIPEAFGPYRVERPLGKTGCGARYLCLGPEGENHGDGPEVVVRTFELGLNERELANIKQRFFAEVQQARRLEHSAILPLRDAGEAQLRLFVVDERVDGWDLRRAAQPNRLLKVPQVLEIAAKCAEALAYAHGRNLLHGEVCPLNIHYLAQDKRIKLGGFGTSTLTASVHAQSDRLLPTSYYLSPEYLTGDTVDGRADLFALGVTLYQLLSGQLPFRADSVATLTYRIVSEAPPPIQALRPEVPDCAVAILERCLAKSPLDRYQDGVALARDLHICAQHALREGAPG